MVGNPSLGITSGLPVTLLLQRNADGRGNRLGDGYGCPSRRRVFPLVICQRSLIGSIRVHHKELAVGLGNAVVERRLIFESQTGAAEENMLSIWRPYLVCVISRRGGQSPQIVPSGRIV